MSTSRAGTEPRPRSSRTEAGAERLRGDARQNRADILAAASEQFRERGFDVAMHDVARSAGVGVGTLYRRFPDRETLVRAVVLDSVRRATERMRGIRSEEATAWEALTRVMAEAASLHLAIDTTLHGAISREELQTADVLAARHELLDVFEGIVLAARREGALRSDVDAGDLAAAVAMVAGVRTVLRPGTRERMLGVVMAGLRAAGHHTALPGTALSRAQYEQPDR